MKAGIALFLFGVGLLGEPARACEIQDRQHNTVGGVSGGTVKRGFDTVGYLEGDRILNQNRDTVGYVDGVIIQTSRRETAGYIDGTLAQDRRRETIGFVYSCSVKSAAAGAYLLLLR